MKSKVQKWGNSLALRIPKTFAEEAHFVDGSDVDLHLRDGRLVVVPILPRPTLKELLKEVRPENLHDETVTGEPQGGEVW